MHVKEKKDLFSSIYYKKCEASFVASQKQLRPDLSEIKLPPPTTRACRDTRSRLVIYVAINFLGFAIDSRFRPHKTLPGLHFPLGPFLLMSERAAVHPPKGVGEG
ncbi:hypothetical protein CDAR_275531 [Caerostris darwini]|uniref:Uncharacterized protein n=1 Tax=Caerostris darwini TaxID=1538125 RepID=A0AAV4UMR3_9ARAC|nr:hypothetical protein CDAR_275531 [Caerostris darwini]